MVLDVPFYSRNLFFSIQSEKITISYSHANLPYAFQAEAYVDVDYHIFVLVL